MRRMKNLCDSIRTLAAGWWWKWKNIEKEKCVGEKKERKLIPVLLFIYFRFQENIGSTWLVYFRRRNLRLNFILVFLSFHFSRFQFTYEKLQGWMARTILEVVGRIPPLKIVKTLYRFFFRLPPICVA